jgi:hypothetical protein
MRLGNSKCLLATTLVVGALGAICWRPDIEQWLRRHQFRIDGIDAAVPTEVYFLETNRWLEFKVPKGASLARLISNASIPAGQPPPSNTQWPYAIRYELLGNQGRTNVAGIYHFRGEHLVYSDKQSGMPVEVNAYLDRRFTALGARNWILNFSDPAATNSRVLRLSLHSMHPELLDVGVRAYFRTENAARKISYLWNRLSDDQKQDLARGNVYSFGGLSERERECVLQYRWAVASAEGIPGRDFERRLLFVRDDTETLQVLKDWVPAGIPIDSEHYGVLALSNAPGSCQLQMVEYSARDVPQVVSNTLLWHGDLQRQLQTNSLLWSGSNVVVLPPRSNGLLQIQSSLPVFVRAFQAEPGTTNEITPEPTHMLTFACSLTNAVEYGIEHVDQEPTFFRVEVRRIPPWCTAEPSPSLIRWELLNAERGCFKRGEATLTNTLSAYDWLVTTNGLTNITVAQSLCFVLPREIRTLRVTSLDGTVFVNAYSRPPQLVKEVHVPDDYSSARSLSPAQPSWFTVRPPDHMARREAGQTCVIRVQPRLPEYDPLVQAGQYEWESFLPESFPGGRMVLVPPAEGQVPREGRLPVTYYPVTVGSRQHVRFQAEPWETLVKPNLVLVFTNESPGTAKVSVDGHTRFENRIEAPVTEISLGQLKPGAHELTIFAAGAPAAYVNYIETTNTAAYLQRFCLTASSNSLSFPYLKRDANSELLVARVFSPGTTNPESFEINVKLKSPGPRGTGPFPALTFMERQARVTPGQTGRPRLVAAADPLLDEGQPLFLPMGPDLPPGLYELELKVKASGARWVSLSRTTPGVAEKLSLFLQMREN